MAPIAKVLAVAALLAAPALGAATPLKHLEARQYQDPNSTLVLNNPACDFYQCTIYWEPGTEVQVNWSNPPQGDVQIDLMTNNNTQVAYNVGTAPAVSNTCDAGAGYGQPGPNGAQCGGFVFTVPSSWNAGNYSALRAMSVQDQNLQSYTDKIYITHNSSTSNNVALSIVSGSTIGSASSTAAASSTGTPGAAAAATTTSGSAMPTGSASASSGSVSKTATNTGSAPSSTSTHSSNDAFSTSAASAAVLTLVAAFTVGLGSLL